MKNYEIWMEGFAVTGYHQKAQKLVSCNGISTWKGGTFSEACKSALITCEWDLRFYDEDRNTFYGCHFYDNELDARKSFG